MEVGDSAKPFAERKGARRVSNAVKQRTARFNLAFDTMILPTELRLSETEDWIRVYLTYLGSRDKVCLSFGSRDFSLRFANER